METGLQFRDFFSNLAGEFANHIESSIPGYARNRSETAYALSRVVREGGTVADIGASEGQFLNALCLARPDINGVNVDPNPDMKAAWNGVPGTSYEVAAWKDGFHDGTANIPAYHSPEPLDVIHMSMVRQFVTADAEGWYREAARQLRPDGLFIVNVKVIATPGDEAGWQAAEDAKDAYKRQFFSEAEISRKAEETLVGMHQLMLSNPDELAALRASFAHVATYWNSYNFYGYVASNDRSRLAEFLTQLKIHRDDTVHLW